jgi:hypothetical protein
MKMKHYLLAIAALVISMTASAQSNNTFADEHLSLSGYLQGGVMYTDNDDASMSTFYLKRARVSLTGKAAEEKIDYRLQVDMAGSPKICDLYFRYKPSDAIGFQFGQFKVPFAIENDIYGPTTFEFIDYSYITTLLARNNAKYDGIASTGRDIGFQMYGGFGDAKDYKTLSYNLAIFNGTGINTQDNNESKDYVARLIYKPSKALSLSASAMYSETIHNARTLYAERWAAGAIYDVEDFIIRAEIAGAEFNDRDVDTFYVMGGYKIKKDWMLVGRYENLNEDFERPEVDWNSNRITLGAVYKPYPFLRMQLNYTLENSGIEDAKSRIKNGGLNFMVTAIF